ncbi:MAG: EF-P 5-aminopentanol modification-associated protein YfmF [Bacilli bacterium]
MEYIKYELGAYNLNVIKTNNFKTVRVEVKFRNVVKKEEITLRNLLKMVLIESTKKFDTERKFVIESEELYDLKLSSTSSRVGNFTTLSFNLTFLNEEYTEKGLHNKSLDFLMEVLFNPNVSNNKFDSLSFNNCVNKLEKSIMGRKDNKTKYSIFALLQHMGDYAYSYDQYGYLSDLKNIDEAKLYEYYKKVLMNDLVDVYVIGNVDSNEIKEYFINNFKINSFKKEKMNVLIDEVLPRKRVKVFKEEDDVNQTKIAIGLRFNDVSEYERKYVLYVYNEILGGSGNSLLFDTVREKNSLAYYINSIAQGYDNLLIIYTGIDKDRVDLGLKLIKKTIKDIEKGKFTSDMFNNAINMITSSLKLSLETQPSVINNYYAMNILNSDDINTRISKFEKVTKEDVINFSKKIKMDTIFLLEGDHNEED